MSRVKIEPGDCVLSLSATNGLFWQDVWRDAANQALANKRKYPTILMPGDTLEVREPQEGEKSGGTEDRHKFSLKGTPARLRLRLRMDGSPVSEKKVKLFIDGTLVEAQTDKDGKVEVPIPPDAVEGRLRVGEDQGEYVLKLGWMTPIDQTSGVQARLYNLGFDPKGIDNQYGSGTRTAMQAFQKALNLHRTERPDQATRDALEKEYGC